VKNRTFWYRKSLNIEHLYIEILSIYRQNCFEFRYDFQHKIIVSNFDAIFDISQYFHDFRYVRNFRFDMQVFSVDTLEGRSEN